ncbi:MAG: carboxypeptidase regulatory-like domain-containing protein [Acidobacteriota bacterium]
MVQHAMFRALAVVFGIAASLTAADLTGLVVADHDGSPVIGAAITLRSAGKVVAEFETDDTGRFRAPGLPAGEYVVSATKASFTTVERRAVISQSGAQAGAQTSTDVLLEVTKLGVISGRVTDNQGNGLRNFVVAAVPVPSDGSPVRVYSSRPKGAVTDASGRYRIFGLTRGDYVLVALAGSARSIADVPNSGAPDTSHGNTAEYYPSGRTPSVLSIRSGEQLTNMDFRAYSGPLFTIRGTVAGPGPDTPYRVSLVAEFVGIPLASATAQPGKEFVFDRVAPGTYKIVASRQDNAGANSIIELINSGQIVVSSANEAAIIRELQAAGKLDEANKQKIAPAFGDTAVTVTSNVTGLSLSARSGVDVKLSYQTPKNCPASVPLTLNPVEYMGIGSTSKKLDAGVELPLSGIPVAAYSVSLTLPESSGCYAVTSVIDFRQVTSGATVPIVVANMGGIRGKAITTGFSPDDFTIVLMTPNGINKRTFALDKNSSFSIPNLRPGNYRLTVSRRSAAHVVAADQSVTVKSGANVEVEFPALP